MSDFFGTRAGSDYLPNFRITTTSLPSDTTSYSCLVESIGGWDMEGNPVEEFIERYLTATIKWDSCSHFVFGDAEDNLGYLHICGVRSYRNHVELMEFLYRHAFEKMGRDPMTGEKWQ